MPYMFGVCVSVLSIQRSRVQIPSGPPFFHGVARRPPVALSGNSAKLSGSPSNSRRRPQGPAANATRPASEPAYLHEVKWTFSPPKGIDPLPGVLVVGQISMWGRPRASP